MTTKSTSQVKKVKSVFRFFSKDIKKDNKNFTTLQAGISELKDDKYELSDSYEESHTDSLFLLNDN